MREKMRLVTNNIDGHLQILNIRAKSIWTGVPSAKILKQKLQNINVEHNLMVIYLVNINVK